MVVACGVEAVEFLGGLPAGFEVGVGVEELFEAGPVRVGEGVAASPAGCSPLGWGALLPTGCACARRVCGVRRFRGSRVGP